MLWWGTRLSFLHVILHKATDTMGSGSLRTGHKQAPLCPRCGSVKAHQMGQGRGRHCVCDQKRLQRQVDTTLLQHGHAPTASRAEGSPTAQVSKTIPGGSTVHISISARIKIQVSKNGVSLDLNQTSYRMQHSDLSVFPAILWPESPFPCLLCTNSYTINLLTYNTTALPCLLNLASTGCPIQNKDTVVQMCRYLGILNKQLFKLI